MRRKTETDTACESGAVREMGFYGKELDLSSFQSLAFSGVTKKCIFLLIL